MAPQQFSFEELRKLPPEERIRRLKQIQELMLDEDLDISPRQIAEEIEAAEALIEESEIEIQEEEQEDEEPAVEEGPEEEESLEERLEGVRREESEGYKLPNVGLYERNTHEAVETLDRLYHQKEWNSKDRELYAESKQTVETALRYETQSDQIKQDLGVGVDLLSKFKYKH